MERENGPDKQTDRNAPSRPFSFAAPEGTELDLDDELEELEMHSELYQLELIQKGIESARISDVTARFGSQIQQDWEQFEFEIQDKDEQMLVNSDLRPQNSETQIDHELDELDSLVTHKLAEQSKQDTKSESSQVDLDRELQQLEMDLAKPNRNRLSEEVLQELSELVAYLESTPVANVSISFKESARATPTLDPQSLKLPSEILLPTIDLKTSTSSEQLTPRLNPTTRPSRSPTICDLPPPSNTFTTILSQLPRQPSSLISSEPIHPSLPSLSHWTYPQTRPFRRYQFDAVHKSLFFNTLCCLPHNSGKLFVSVCLLLNYSRWFPHGKAVFVSTKQARLKQISVEREVNKLLDLEDWAVVTQHEPQQERLAHYNNRKVLFVEAQVFSRDLQAEFLDISAVKLVVYGSLLTVTQTMLIWHKGITTTVSSTVSSLVSSRDTDLLV